MANPTADRIDPTSVLDYIASDEETSSDGKGGKGGVCSVGCSSSSVSSSEGGTRQREINDGKGQLSSEGERGGVVEERGEGVTTGEKGTPDVAEGLKGLGIEEKGGSGVLERVEAEALVASEAKGDGAIKNEGKKAVIEEEDRNEALASLPEEPPVPTTLVPARLEPNRSKAQQEYCCNLCGVFYRSVDGSPDYKPFPTGKPESRSSKLSIYFLPEPVDVLASSYGLLCCRATRNSGRYYACNPTTMDWTRLPLPPVPHNHNDDTEVTLVFEKTMTAFRFESDYHVVCAYPVLGIQGGVYAFDVFSSKTRQWTTSKDLCIAELLIPASGIGVAGKACWTTTMNTAVIFDPAKDDLRTVPWPVGYSGGDVIWSLAELQGELCAVCVLSSGGDVATEVYTLENCSEGDGAMFGWTKKWGTVCRVPDSACPLPGQSETEVLFKNGNELLAVDVVTGWCRIIGGDEEPILGDTFLPYTSSLVGASGPA